jgi:hypothetical protein
MRDVFCKACEVRPLRRDQNYWDRNDILFGGFQRVTKDRMANDNFLFLPEWRIVLGKLNIRGTSADALGHNSVVTPNSAFIYNIEYLVRADALVTTLL